VVITRGQIHADWKVPEEFRIRTGRLELVPGGPELSHTDWREHEKLSALLGADVPGQWPPELVVDRSSPDGTGWWDWYVVTREVDRPVLIGVVGIKGWPSVTGSVQEGGAFLPQFHRRGYATEAFSALTEWVFKHPRVDQITFDAPIQSIGGVALLRRLGFSLASSDEGEGLLRFEKKRP
jgi:RimJ/RimL family protein N-acetyltransferase